MDCTNCELPIDGNRYDNAITIDRRGWREEVLHFECVDDPTQLHPEQFQKWTAWLSTSSEKVPTNWPAIMMLL